MCTVTKNRFLGENHFSPQGPACSSPKWRATFQPFLISASSIKHWKLTPVLWWLQQCLWAVTSHTGGLGCAQSWSSAVLISPPLYGLRPQLTKISGFSARIHLSLRGTFPAANVWHISDTRASEWWLPAKHLVVFKCILILSYWLLVLFLKLLCVCRCARECVCVCASF